MTDTPPTPFFAGTPPVTPKEDAMRHRKREIVWGIRQYGMFLPFLTRSTRKQAIEDTRDYAWRAEDTTMPTWSQLRRREFTVHKLEVRDVR